MDYALAIRRNRDQLKAIVLALFALADMRVGGSLFTLRRDIFAAILAVLRPAESAVRRLILIAALGLKPSTSVTQSGRWPDLPPSGRAIAYDFARAKLFRVGAPHADRYLWSGESEQEPNRIESGTPSSPAIPASVAGEWISPPKAICDSPAPRGGPQAGETGGSPWGREAARGGPGVCRAFKLFDPLKHFDSESIWDNEPVWESQIGLFDQHFHYTSTLETPINATHIAQRLNALIRALENIPAQARRLARWQIKRDALLKAHKPTRISPMRPGLPPGWRERKIHEIDDVLRECHGLAHDRLNSS